MLRAAALRLAFLLGALVSNAAGCVLLPTLSGPPPKLEKIPPPSLGECQDIRGIIHCHSHLSHDSNGSLEEITKAAREAGVRFIAMTDHFTPRAVNEGVHGERDGVIFMTGVELARGGGSLLGLGLFDASATATARPVGEHEFDGSVKDAIAAIHRDGGLAFVGHAEEFRNWDEIADADGIEIRNLHADAKRMRWWSYLFYGLFTTPPCFFTRLIDDPRDVLAKWDEIGKTRRMPGVGGCDCHANVRLFGPLGGTIGDYPECFRAVTTHVLLPLIFLPEKGDPPADLICDALHAGRCYVAFEIGGDASGFTFELLPTSRSEARHEGLPQGCEVALKTGMRLHAHAPGGERVRLDLLCDGKVVASKTGGDLFYDVPHAGVYRVEAYLDGDLFILSNPIYVR